MRTVFALPLLMAVAACAAPPAPQNMANSQYLASCLNNAQIVNQYNQLPSNNKTLVAGVNPWSNQVMCYWGDDGPIERITSANQLSRCRNAGLANCTVLAVNNKMLVEPAKSPVPVTAPAPQTTVEDYATGALFLYGSFLQGQNRARYQTREPHAPNTVYGEYRPYTGAPLRCTAEGANLITGAPNYVCR